MVRASLPVTGSQTPEIKDHRDNPLSIDTLTYHERLFAVILLRSKEPVLSVSSVGDAKE